MDAYFREGLVHRLVRRVLLLLLPVNQGVHTLLFTFQSCLSGRLTTKETGVDTASSKNPLSMSI